MGAGAFGYINQFIAWLAANNPGNLCVVEIGSERGEGSTRHFATFCAQNNMAFYTVDMDERSYSNALHVCNEIQGQTQQEILSLIHI